MNRDYLRGNVDTIILKCLENGELYGIEICNAVRVATEGTYDLKKPTLYSALKRLQSAKLVRERADQSPIGGERHYYALTDQGREHLEDKKYSWVHSKSLLDNIIFSKSANATQPLPFEPVATRTESTAAASAVGTFIDTYATERAIAERITASASANAAVAQKPIAQMQMAQIAVETRTPSPIEEYSAKSGGFITIPLQRGNDETATEVNLFKPFVKHASDPRNGKFVLFNRLRAVSAAIVATILFGALWGLSAVLRDTISTQESNFLFVGVVCVAVYFLYNAVLFASFPKYKQVVTNKSNGILRRIVLSACVAIASLSVCILAGMNAYNSADFLVYWVTPWIVGCAFVLEGLAIHALRRTPFFLT